MAKVIKGDMVKVHYTGRFTDGTVFDSSFNRAPLKFTIGDGKIVPGFEESVIGMIPGEHKTAQIPADEAYGCHDEEMVVVLSREQFPEHIYPEIGQQLKFPREEGEMIVIMVTDISKSTVTLDGNHPLAGKDLIFDIELIEIV